MRLKRKTYQVDTGRSLTNFNGDTINLREEFPDEETYQNFIHWVLTDFNNWSVVRGTLPEVNHTFGNNPDDHQDLKDFRQASDLVGQDMVKWWDTNTIRRFIRAYNDSGSPKVFHRFIGPPHYNTLLNYMGASDTREFVSELSHAFQTKNKVLKGKSSYIKNGVFQLFGRPFARFKWARKIVSKFSPYEDPENGEYRAHEIIEPLLSKYIFENDEGAYNTLMQARGLPEDQQLDMLQGYLDSTDQDK